MAKLEIVLSCIVPVAVRMMTTNVAMHTAMPCSQSIYSLSAGNHLDVPSVTPHQHLLHPLHSNSYIAP